MHKRSMEIIISWILSVYIVYEMLGIWIALLGELGTGVGFMGPVQLF